MGLYEPKSCCFCFDTKNGSLILASLSLIGSILIILSAVSGYLGFFLDAALEPMVQSHALDTHDKRNIIMYVCIAVLAFAAFAGLCSILLIHGIRKDRPGLMLPYLILQRFYIAMYMILIVVTLAASMRFNIQTHFLLMVKTIITSYFHLVINAYHKQVKRDLLEDYHKFNNDGTDSIVQDLKAV